MKRKLNFWRKFWRWYAFYYDGLRRMIPYQLMVKQIIDCIPNDRKLYLLDAGCGTGLLVEKLKEERPDITAEGIDFSASMLSIAKSKNTGAIFKEADLNEPLPYEDNTFDIITSIHVIYNVLNPKKTIEELKRILKKNGILIIASPKKNSSVHKVLVEHISCVGFFKSIPLLFSLLILWSANMTLFFKKKEQHFFDKEELKHVAEIDNEAISATYANQSWFVCIYNSLKIRK